jgi:adenylosuccinate synthase|tara:strand:+ start:3150 stop:3380 length:231 start_codon:yes stop_codon:yes gene_type:complete
MAKVGVKIGFTFRVGPLDTNQYGRVDMEMHDIDTELSIDEQIKESGLAMDKMFQTLIRKVDAEVESILKETTSGNN